MANEFFARYVPNRVKAILIARPIYQYLLDKERLEQISRRHQISYPITVDYNGLMAAAFGVQDFPAVRLVSQEGVMIQRDGPKWMDGFESQLQLFLRKADPGLPLLPLLEFSGKAPREVLRIELGKDPITQSANPEKSLLVPEPPEDLEPGFFYFTGRWEQDGEKVVTTDEHAQVVFRSPASIVNLVGQSLGVTYEAGKIVVEIEDSNALDVFGGQDLEFDDEGRSVIRVSTPRIYHALINLPESTRRIRLRFPNADIAKIALYGFRFCD